MPISSQEATAALAAVTQTERRASRLRSYEYGAPHFFLWGLIWILGYGSGALTPQWSGVVWIVLDVVGFAGSFWIGRRAARLHHDARSGFGLRFAAGVGTYIALAAAIVYVMQPHQDAQVAALPALLVATAYILTGIFRGPRWLIIGVVLGLLTIGGYAFLKPDFMLWMAGAGGGSLLLTGFWLRNA